MTKTKKKLYIETSVWNQLEHTDRPDWRETAERFFETIKAGLYEAYISSVVVDEINATADTMLQAKLVEHINRVDPIMLEFDSESLALTEHYIASEFGGISSQRVYNDCRHVAVATVNDLKHIVSFNCRHLVNDRRIDGFNAINIRCGYDHMVDICTPHKFVIKEEEDTL
jgi:predicted nucleic acid-binding protein